MNTPIKVLTSLALAAAGAFPGAAFGVSGKAIAGEAGGAFLFEVADFAMAITVAGLGGYTPAAAVTRYAGGAIPPLTRSPRPWGAT